MLFCDLFIFHKGFVQLSRAYCCKNVGNIDGDDKHKYMVNNIKK